MKKLLLMLFALLTTAGAGAQVVTNRDSAGDPMTFEQFKDLAGTGKHFALMAPSSADLTYKKWFSFSKAGYPTTLTTVQLFDLENSVTGDGWYNIKRISDHLYVSTEGGNFDATTKMDFKLVNRRAGDYAPEFENAALHISLDNADGNHYNCNTTNLGFRAGTGGYSTYIAYGPFYLVTVNCVDESNAPIQYPITYIVKDGATISKPEIYDYISVGENESVTVNGEDVEMTCHYKRNPNAVDWTPSIDSEAYLTIGEKVASISVTDDPEDNTKWYVLTQVRNGETPMYDVGTGSQLKRTATSITTTTINGTLASSNTQYLIRFVSAGNDLYNIQFANGNWITENLTTSNSKGDAGNYVFYNTNGGVGSYFAWNLNSKEGKRVDNNGAGNTVAFWSTGEQSGTSGNSIWYIYETTLEVPSNFVKYVISDANGVVFTSEDRPTTVGETITALPSDLQRDFCSYGAINQTMVAGENTVNVTVSYNLPFKVSTSFDEAIWYYATIRDTKYLRADDSQKDANNRYTTSSSNEHTDVFKWAFFGNPYANFYIANKGQGEGKYLNASTVPTFEIVANPVSTDATLWEAIQNNNGFTLRSITGATMYINDASGAGNLGYWNSTYGRTDAGGKWVVEEVPATEIEVTYNVVLEGRTVATTTELQGIGNAPVIPSALERDYTTYTFNVEEISASTTTIEATPVFDGPFEPSTNFDDAKWYYLYGHSTYNGSGVYTDGDDIKWQQGVKENTDAYKWAFIGNPVEGFKLINKATGVSKFIQGTTPATMGETGTSWTLKKQTNETYQKNGEGFGLWDASLTYLNVRSGQGNLQYWSGFDQGSTYWVEAVPDIVVDVTYNLVVEGTVVKTIVDEQVAANSEVTIPSSLTTGYSTLGYDFTTEGTIGEEDCTITVTAALKTGVITDLTNLSNSKAYTLSTERGDLYIKTDHLASNSNANAGASAGTFALIRYENNYYLYSVDASKFVLGDGSLSSTPTPSIATLTLSPQTLKPLFLGVLGGQGLNVTNTNDDYELVINSWVTADAGNRYCIAEVEDFDATNAINALNDYFHGTTAFNNAIAQLEAYPYGTGLNQYSLVVEGDDYTSQAADIINSLKSDGYTAENLTYAQLMLDGTSINLPTAGFYRIKGKTSGKYLAAGLASNGKFAMSDATDATTIFYFDGSTLSNFGSGMSNGMNASDWAWVVGAQASTVVFQDGLTNGGYGIKSATANFYDNGDNTASADRGSNVTINASTNARYTSWALEEVSELPISLNAVGSEYYATLCVPFNVTLAGAEAYTLTLNAEENELDLGEALTEVPAGTPVLLKGSAATATATIGTNYVNAPVESTLTGVFFATTVPAETDYFLGKKDGEVGFYKWTGTTLKANRAYLPASAVSADVKGLRLNFGDADAIEAIVNGQSSMVNGNIYNLAGQRVSKATKGIYVKNGKKVVIK